jgi:hypothetical protein
MEYSRASITSRKLNVAFVGHRAAGMVATRDDITRALLTENSALAGCTSAQIAAVLRRIDCAYHDGRATVDSLAKMHARLRREVRPPAGLYHPLSNRMR